MSFSLPLRFSITHFYGFVWVNYTTTILTRAALLALSKSIYHEIALNLKPGPHESRHFETAYYVTRIRVDRTWKLYNHIPVQVPLPSRSHSSRVLNHMYSGERFQKDKRCSLDERFHRFGVCERSSDIWKIRLKKYPDLCGGDRSCGLLWTINHYGGWNIFTNLLYFGSDRGTSSVKYSMTSKKMPYTTDLTLQSVRKILL